MANNAKVMDSIKNFLEKMKANDAAIPEELAEDACTMVEEVKDALCECEDEDPKTEGTKDEEPKEDTEKKVEDAMVKVLRKYGLIKDGAMESLDELEKKLGEEETDDVDGEESVTVDPEKMNDNARRELLKQVKPIIAGVKDSAQRKALSDAFAKSIGFGMDKTADYAKILESTKKSAQDAASQKKLPVDSADFGMEIARKYNPHYMKEGN